MALKLEASNSQAKSELNSVKQLLADAEAKRQQIQSKENLVPVKTTPLSKQVTSAPSAIKTPDVTKSSKETTVTASPTTNPTINPNDTTTLTSPSNVTAESFLISKEKTVTPSPTTKSTTNPNDTTILPSSNITAESNTTPLHSLSLATSSPTSVGENVSLTSSPTSVGENVSSTRDIAVKAQNLPDLTTPKSFYEFENIWQSLANDDHARAKYFKLVSPNSYKSLFKGSMTDEILSSILKLTFKFYLSEDPAYTKEILVKLPSVERFDMLAMFLSDESKDVIKAIIEKLNQKKIISQSEIDNLESIYDLSLIHI
eukprot:TRINITY_DN9992_c0_g1_i1.p1 TRINITY_DN9992_c0_g1~~TRINITY_DN9992_c0_g1_i1.p1  ORF type:complete len:315 (+),score=57.15 TRINITY_DN9992_c0_g1_i1:191-1135(+)